MGDALAVCLQDLRGFSSKDFAKYHPGGALGKRLYLRVSDLIKNNQTPTVDIDSSIAKVIVEISEKRLGATAVLENKKLVGIITDGDIRRMLTKTTDINHFTAKDIMGKDPKTVSQDAMAIEALEKLERDSITQILVVDAQGKYAGVVHLHDLIKEGIF
jgi:arabinose-5-phosphate isomerase